MGTKRHPAQVTADRLGNHIEDYYDFMDGSERDDVSRVIFMLEQIAAGTRERYEEQP